jgi:hypothetical protein
MYILFLSGKKITTVSKCMHRSFVYTINPTVVATALFFHIISRPQVALNLAAQVTCDLAVRRHTPSLLPPTTVFEGPSTQSLLLQ